MIHRWIDAKLKLLLIWLDANLVAPAVARIVKCVRAELAAEGAEIRASLQAHAISLAGEITAAKQEMWALHEELVQRPATVEQMAGITARLDRVDERVAHLAARMYGKKIAHLVEQSRGPREFSIEERQ